MGSSFSIYNDTGTNIYVWNGVQWDYVALGLGIGLAGGAVVAAPAVVGAPAIAAPVIGGAAGVVPSGISVGTSNEEQRKLAAINTFKKESDRKLAPGQIYTYNGSLSMTRSVYLLAENGDSSSRGCWTGTENKSDIRYNVSRDWDWSHYWI